MKAMHLWSWLFVLVTVVMPFCASSAEQDQSILGEIYVTVKHQKTNRVIAEANLSLSDREGKTYTLKTDSNGQVSFTALAAGLYDLTVTKTGFNNVVQNSIRVINNRVSTVRISMPETDSMEVITVTSSKSNVTSGEPVSTTYMDREGLRSAIGGGSDVMRALDGLPGLVSTGEFASFSVRGRGPRDNLIYVDNMPFDKIVHFDASLGETEDVDGGGRFSIFAPNLIQSAEFSPGGWGAAYGGKAGSLLQLDVVAGGKTPTASFRLDVAGYEVGYEGPSGIADNTSIIFNARHLDFGEFFDTIDEKDIGEPVLSDILFKSVTEIDSENTIEFLALFSPEEYTRDLEHVVESPDFEDVEVAFNEQDSTLVGLTWLTLLGSESELSSNIYYRTSDKSSSQGEAYPDLVPLDTPYQDIPVRRDILMIDEEETEIGLRLDLTTFNAIGEINMGLEVRDYDLSFDTVLDDNWIQFTYDQDDFRPSPEQKYIVLMPEFINSSYDITATSIAGYVEQTYRWHEYQINAGVRYDRDDLSEQDLFSPRFNLSWTPSITSQYTFSTGIFYQAPRFLDRASDPENEDLENEKITHVSIGGNWLLTEEYNLLVELYYQDLDKLVVDSARTDGLLSNNGEGDSYGMDAVLTRYFTDDWSGQFTYSYNESTRDDNDGEGEYDADNHRPHVVTLALSWEINQNWKIGARWKYYTGEPDDDFIINENVLGDGNPLRYSQEYFTNNTERKDNFHQLNVRVDYFKTWGPVNIIAFVDVLNVLATSTDGEEEFNNITGEYKSEDGEVIPWLGLKFETSW
ncbi:TonB-dependent receptor [Thalassotalea sp. Y01]|uniref:TonB-dependent receptor n=1 Tax=Thalassotalea sp. Y01 TaxID=2729613 RepID=UPI00145D57EF|nr:TonB-dependent receptor [Thalassotalea sp. Y01]NMP15273.1 TonB-dependent receptor [Thalassotalea sp. Y01]